MLEQRPLVQNAETETASVILPGTQFSFFFFFFRVVFYLFTQCHEPHLLDMNHFTAFGIYIKLLSVVIGCADALKH